MYRYQHSKAAQELAEIRRALNSLQTSGPGLSSYKHQNLPLPPIPKPKDHIYQPPSVISNNSCSTENKYETIGKSLEPFKIQEENNKKPKRLPSTGSSYSSSGSSSGSAQVGDYGFSSSVSPMSVATTTGQNGSQSPSSSSDDVTRHTSHVTSSHYAQISPLRGQGLPPPSMMGLRNTDQRSMAHSPAKSYFEVRSSEFLLE